MTTRSQKRKAIAELASGDFETSLAENNSTENLIPSSSKNPRLELENLEEIKTTLRKEIMTDLTKILAENQKEMLKLIAPASKKRSVNLNMQDSDSDQENISVARTSTPVKTQTATSSKTTPNNSRNILFGLGHDYDWFRVSVMGAVGDYGFVSCFGTRFQGIYKPHHSWFTFRTNKVFSNTCLSQLLHQG